MKSIRKYLLIVAAVLLTITLSACGTKVTAEEAINKTNEASKNLKNTKTNINEEKWLEFFRNFPKYKDIIFEYEKLGEKYFENEESKLLEIKKPDFRKPLHIDKD